MCNFWIISCGLCIILLLVEKGLHLEGIDELWMIASPILGWDEDRLPTLRAKNPVIVVEGLDGTGKGIIYMYIRTCTPFQVDHIANNYKG